MKYPKMKLAYRWEGADYELEDTIGDIRVFSTSNDGIQSIVLVNNEDDIVAEVSSDSNQGHSWLLYNNDFKK